VTSVVTGGLAAADAPALCAALLARATARGADAVQVSHSATEHFEIEFESRAVTLVRSTSDESVALTLFRDGKRGAASINGRDPEAIEGALTEALTAADAGVPDPANGVADAPSQPASVHGDGAADRKAMLDAVLACVGELAARYPKIRAKNATYSFDIAETCFANSRGVVQRERRSSYSVGVPFIAKDGTRTSSFNWAGASSFDPYAALLDAGAVRRLIEDALRSLEPRPVPEKFVGDVIMTPECLSGFANTLAGALGGYQLMAGTTPYKDRKGERIADPRFSLLNRPRAPEFPGGGTFDGFGIPTRDLDVVRDGVLEDFLVDFYISRKLGLAHTAGPWNFVVPSGDRAIDDVIAGTQRGILLCRLSGGIPTANLDFTGVAKNSFYVEDGAIRYPLIETMIAGNLQDLLKQIHAISRESVNFGGGRFPYLAAGGVTISSKA
jgi:PmbA protein